MWQRKLTVLMPARLLVLQALGLGDTEVQREMDVGASDEALTQRKSAPAAVQRAPKRKRAEMSASPANDAGGHDTRRASRRRRLSAPASHLHKGSQEPTPRERAAVKRNNARLLREAAAKRAASSHPSAGRSVAAGARSPPVADLSAEPQRGEGSAEDPQSPDVAGPVQVLAVCSCRSAAH